MTDVIELRQGVQPWLPDLPSTRPVELYRQYDGPLSGIVEQHGVQYLFNCVVGEVDAISYWIYSVIEPGERLELERLDGVEVHRWMHDHALSRPGRVALALEGYGIIATGTFTSGDDWDEAVTSVSGQFDAWLAGVRKHSQSQREKISAGV